MVNSDSKKEEAVWAQGVMRGSEAYISIWDTPEHLNMVICALVPRNHNIPMMKKEIEVRLLSFALCAKSRLLHLKPLPLY